MTSEKVEDRLEFGRSCGAPPTAIALGRTQRDQRNPSLPRSAAAHVPWATSLAQLQAEAWQQPTHHPATALLSHWSGGAILPLAFQSPLTSLAALRQRPRPALHLDDVDDGDWGSQPSADPLAAVLQPAAGAAAAAAVQEPEEQGEGHCPRNWRRAPPPLPLFPSGGLDMTPLLRSRMLQLLQQQEHEQQQLQLQQQQQQQHPKRRQQRPAGIVYRGLLPPAALQQHAASAHAPTGVGGDAGGPLARPGAGGTGAVTGAVTGTGGYRGSGGFPDACRPRDSSPPPTRGRSPDSAVDEEELEDGPVSFVLRVQKDNKDGYCLSGLAGIRHFFPRQLRAATASRISQPVELWFRVPTPGGGKVLREYALSVRVNKDRDRLNGILSRATALARDMDLCPGDTLTLSALSDGRPVAEPDEPVQPDAVRLTSAILCQSAWRIPMSMARHLLGDATASRPHQVIPVLLDGAQMTSSKGATLRSHVQTKGTSVRWSFLRLTVMLKAHGAVPGDTLRLGAVRSAAAVAGATAPGSAAAAAATAATAAAAGPSSNQVPGSSTTVIAIKVRLERAGSGAGQGTEAPGTPPPLQQPPQQQQPKAAAESAVAEAVGPRAGEGAATAAAHVRGSGHGKPATTAETSGRSSDRDGSGSDIEGSADLCSSAGDSGDAGGSDISSDDGTSAAAAAERRAGGEKPPAVAGSRWAVMHGLGGAAAAGGAPPANEAAATGSVTDTLAPSARTGREAGAGWQPSGAAAAAKLTRQTAVAVDTAVTAAAFAAAGGQSGAPAAAQPPDVPAGQGNHPRVGGQGGAGYCDPGSVGRDRLRRRRDAEAESDTDDGPHRRRRREDSRSRRDNSSGVSGSGSDSGNRS